VLPVGVLASVEGRAGAATEAVEDVVLGVVWNGFHQVGDQVLPLWQPVIAATDKRANAPRRIELRIFRCPLIGTRSRSR
jgi:hypothetical protein